MCQQNNKKIITTDPWCSGKIFYSEIGGKKQWNTVSNGRSLLHVSFMLMNDLNVITAKTIHMEKPEKQLISTTILY